MPLLAYLFPDITVLKYVLFYKTLKKSLRVISVNRCLIFKVHPALFPIARRLSSSELCYYTKPPSFCQHLFSSFFSFSSPPSNSTACCLFLSPNFRSLSGRFIPFIYTISCFSAVLFLLLSISCYFFFVGFFLLFFVFGSVVEFWGLLGELGLLVGVGWVSGWVGGWLWGGVSSDFK